ncbi:MAG: hypothetical protein JWL66_339 [Sphingomonadales bacterium]|nr:hypothetical protein [Sphingomonadales bacterium]
MATKKKKPLAHGRPAMDDALDVYLYVKVGSQRAGLSVRTFCNRWNTEFKPRSFPPALGDRSLKKDALRRRYGVAQHVIGLKPTRWFQYVIPADPEVKKTMDRMVKDLLEAK